MSMPPVETEITPPTVRAVREALGLPSARLGVHYLAVDEVHYDAAAQLFGDAASDPDRFADALLGSALALAALCGSDHSRAVMQRFAAYDGTPPR